MDLRQDVRLKKSDEMFDGLFNGFVTRCEVEDKG